LAENVGDERDATPDTSPHTPELDTSSSEVRRTIRRFTHATVIVDDAIWGLVRGLRALQRPGRDRLLARPGLPGQAPGDGLHRSRGDREIGMPGMDLVAF